MILVGDQFAGSLAGLVAMDVDPRDRVRSVGVVEHPLDGVTHRVVFLHLQMIAEGLA